MRAELVFEALSYESNRYALVRMAARATRMLHRPNTRVQDSMNDALRYLARPHRKPAVLMAKPLPASRRDAA